MAIDASSQEDLSLNMLTGFLLLVYSILGQPVDWCHLPHSGWAVPQVVSGSICRDTQGSVLRGFC